MSRLRQSMSRRKLENMLGLIPDAEFFLLCWATHALQTGREDRVQGWFQYPREAAVQDLSATYAVYPWLIETLLNECLAVPKDPRGRRLRNVRRFEVMPPLRNALTELENAEDGLMLKRLNVLDTFHLLAQRQFEWQRGVWSRPHLYRSGYLYGGQHTRRHFQAARGLPLDDFSLAAFLLRGLFLEHPVIAKDVSLATFGMSSDVMRAALRLVSLPLREARSRARDLRASPGHTAYKPSLLRTHPCLELEDGLVAGPLPDLVTRRGTTGIFYDVIDGPEDVKNEIARRFEQYCHQFLSATLPGLRVAGEHRYRMRKGMEFDTPDVLIHQEEALSLIVECKATRMSYIARFAEDPVSSDPRGYGEMVRGIFQIWRFASHIRRGLVPDHRLGSAVRGLVVTLENWLCMSESMLERMRDQAIAMAAARDPEILAQDRIPVAFCPIEELEQTMATATPGSFLAATRAATTDDYRGWMLSTVHGRLAPELCDQNEYPFADRIPEVLPWWDNFAEESQAAL